MIQFGEFLPDLADLLNPGCTIAKNVFPRAGGTYGPIGALATYSTALTGRAYGAYSDRDRAGTVNTFAGDATKLYLLDGSAAFNDVSRLAGGAYTTATTSRWDFGTHSSGTTKRVLASNWDDAPQAWTLGSSANFAALGGTPPKYKTGASIKGFWVVGYTNDGSDGNQPLRVWRSAINDPTSWPTPGGATATSVQSGYDTLSTGQEIRKIVGGLSGCDGIVFCERAIFRVTYVGPGKVLQFDDIARDVGTISQGAVVQAGDAVYYISEHGVEWTNGYQTKSISMGKVNRWFRDTYDSNYPQRISSISVPNNELVIWSFPSRDAVAGTPDTILIYNYVADRFSYAKFSHELVWRAATAGYTLDGLDAISSSLDALPASLDDTAWNGGAQQLAYFSTAHKLAFPTGDNLEAVIETREFAREDGRRFFCPGFRVLSDAATVTGYPKYRDTPSATNTSGTAASAGSNGVIPCRFSARYARAVVTVAAAQSWTHLQGIEPTLQPEGLR